MIRNTTAVATSSVLLFTLGCFGNGELIDLNTPPAAMDAAVDGGPLGEYMEIRLNTSSSGAAVQETVSNFPVLIRLTERELDFGSETDGKSLTFTDENGAPLCHEIERFDVDNRLALIWVNAAAVKGNTADQSIRLYPHPTGFVSQSCPVFTDETGFACVLHLDEDGNNSQDGFYDATDRHRHATGTNMNGDIAVEGAVGRGLLLDGSAYLTVPGLLNHPQQLTVSLWTAPKQTGGDLISLGDSVVLRVAEGGTPIYGLVYDGTTWNTVEASIPQDGAPHHIAFVVDAAARRQEIFLDGNSMDGRTAELDIDYSIGYPDLTIGVHAQKDRLFYTGLVDEVEIATTSRSASWIKLCYENQRPMGQSLVEILP